MMPPIPAVVMLPTDTAHGYWPATVVAAIPLGHGNLYAVTAIDPKSSPDAPRFLVGEAGRNIHGFWIANTSTFPIPASDLTRALGRMCDLASRPGCPQDPRLLPGCTGAYVPQADGFMIRHDGAYCPVHHV